MKTVRIIILMLIAGLVLSVWTPSTASAKTEDDQAIFATALNGSLKSTRFVVLTVDNRTGGVLYITLNILRYAKDPTPRQDYFLLAAKQGKNEFQVLPGRYIYTIRSSNCGGHKMNTKNFTGNILLGPYYCGNK
jgi:hypothetical protein